jgi:Domain of unknown function (DUF4249)
MKLILILSLIVIIQACTKQLDIKIPSDEKDIVVNALINPDSTFRVHLSYSIPIMDSILAPHISDAAIEVYENDLYLCNLAYNDSGYYASNAEKPAEGKMYKLVIKHAETETVASETIPISVPIVSLDTSWITIKKIKYLKCIIVFNDLPDTKNYYMLGVWGQKFTNSKYGQFESLDLTNYDQAVDNENKLDNRIFFNDEAFNGNEHKTMIVTEVNNNDRIIIQFMAISNSYYNYCKSYILQMNSVGHPYTERVPVFSNIIGGLGILAGYSSSIKTIDLK